MEINEKRRRMKIPLLITGFSLGVVLFCSMKPANPSEVIVPFESYCMPLEKLQSLINKYSEVPMIDMTSTRLLSDGTIKHNGTTLFVNLKETSWTLVEQTDKNVYCVIGAGMNLSPSKQGNNQISR